MQATTFTTTLGSAQLADYADRLLASNFPDGLRSSIDLQAMVVETLGRVEFCFSGIHRKYYSVDGAVEFNHLNSDHMCAFLYLLANTIWKRTGDTILPTKLFYLNKILNGVDLYFSVELPPVFLLVHPVGSVIGNANYGNHLVVYQNCTIGADAGTYPTFGEGVILYSRASVLGACSVGSNVVFSANSFIVNTDIAPDSIVLGAYPNHRVIPNPVPVLHRIFEPA